VGNSSKNAISLVNEYAQANSLKIEFSCNSCGPEHRKRYLTSPIGANLICAEESGQSLLEV